MKILFYSTFNSGLGGIGLILILLLMLSLTFYICYRFGKKRNDIHKKK